jgi:hypothetical protein
VHNKHNVARGEQEDGQVMRLEFGDLIVPARAMAWRLTQAVQKT